MRFLSVNLDKLEFCDFYIAGQVLVVVCNNLFIEMKMIEEQIDKIFLQKCKDNIVFLSFPNSVGSKNGKKTEG